MKDPNTALKSTSWCLCRKQSLAYTFTTFKSESFPMLLENTKWGRFELESYLMMLKTHTGVLCCFYKSMGCLEVLCVSHATRDFGAMAVTGQRLKFLQQAHIWGFSPLSLFVSTLVHTGSCCLSSPHTVAPNSHPNPHRCSWTGLGLAYHCPGSFQTSQGCSRPQYLQYTKSIWVCGQDKEHFHPGLHCSKKKVLLHPFCMLKADTPANLCKLAHEICDNQALCLALTAASCFYHRMAHLLQGKAHNKHRFLSKPKTFCLSHLTNWQLTAVTHIRA